MPTVTVIPNKIVLGKDVCNGCAIEAGLTPAMLKKEKRCKTCGKVSMCGKPTMPILRAAPAKQHTTRGTARVATCPHCHEEITRVNYSVDVNEYGSVDLDLGTEEEDGRVITSDDYEVDGSENNGNEYYYTCQECGEEISDLDDLISTDDDTEDTESEPGNKDAEVN